MGLFMIFSQGEKCRNYFYTFRGLVGYVIRKFELQKKYWGK